MRLAPRKILPDIGARWNLERSVRHVQIPASRPHGAWRRRQGKIVGALLFHHGDCRDVLGRLGRYLVRSPMLLALSQRRQRREPRAEEGNRSGFRGYGELLVEP